MLVFFNISFHQFAHEKHYCVGEVSEYTFFYSQVICQQGKIIISVQGPPFLKFSLVL